MLKSACIVSACAEECVRAAPLVQLFNMILYMHPDAWSSNNFVRAKQSRLGVSDVPGVVQVSLIPVAKALERCAGLLQGAETVTPHGGPCFADTQVATVSALLRAYGAGCRSTGQRQRHAPAVMITDLSTTCVLGAVDLEKIDEKGVRVRVMGVTARRAYLTALKQAAAILDQKVATLQLLSDLSSWGATWVPPLQ